MKIYKVHMVLTLVMPRLKQYSLEDYNSNTPIIFVEAEDPDDACYSVFKAFCDIILEQDDSTETKLLLKDLKYDFRVSKLHVKKL